MRLTNELLRVVRKPHPILPKHVRPWADIETMVIRGETCETIRLHLRDTYRNGPYLAYCVRNRWLALCTDIDTDIDIDADAGIEAEPRGRREDGGTTWARSAGFRDACLELHGARCMVCGDKRLAVLDAAHIVAVADGGSDDSSNGLVLCATHHRAFDAAELYDQERRTLNNLRRDRGLLAD